MILIIGGFSKGKTEYLKKISQSFGSVVIVGIEYMGKKRLNVVHSVAIRKDFSSCLVIIIKKQIRYLICFFIKYLDLFPINRNILV